MMIETATGIETGIATGGTGIGNANGSVKGIAKERENAVGVPWNVNEKGRGKESVTE